MDKTVAMTKKQITAKVTEIIDDKLENEFAAPDDYDSKLSADLRIDLGADSLDMLAITMKLEEEFNIMIKDEIAEDMRTVQNHVDVVCKILDS